VAARGVAHAPWPRAFVVSKVVLVSQERFAQQTVVLVTQGRFAQTFGVA
jgi:hypothetical protein